MKLQTFKFNFKFIRLPKPDVVCNKCSTDTQLPRLFIRSDICILVIIIVIKSKIK